MFVGRYAFPVVTIMIWATTLVYRDGTPPCSEIGHSLSFKNKFRIIRRKCAAKVVGLQFFSSINAFLAFGAPGKQGDYKIPLCDSAA